MKIKTIIGCLGVGALCVATGGLAAPAVGAVVGSTFMGLSGAAATSAGLAALGGGSLAVGGMGMAGGTAIVAGVAGGVGAIGTGIVGNTFENTKKENDNLRDRLNDAHIDAATKQRCIMQLNADIKHLNNMLIGEKAKTIKNEEMIRELEERLEYAMLNLNKFRAA
ncbi:MAG: hypothetical protein RR063_11860 [Anaerovoracaceae bacterium]